MTEVQLNLFTLNAYHDATAPAPARDGETFEAALDGARLNAQAMRVFSLMRDGVWRTLREISEATGDPEASASARIRDLRKPRFGKHTVHRRRRGDGKKGLFEYRLEVVK